ncbi:hypothetical protein ABK040_014097 [Willaertia magna]
MSQSMEEEDDEYFGNRPLGKEDEVMNDFSFYNKKNKGRNTSQQSAIFQKPVSFVSNQSRQQQSLFQQDDELLEDEIILEEIIEDELEQENNHPKQQTTSSSSEKSFPNFTILQPKKKISKALEENYNNDNNKNKGLIGEEERKLSQTINATEGLKKNKKVKKDEEFGSFINGKVGANVLNMMFKMGWKDDKGLGKNLDGLLNPIKVVPTARNQAIIITDDHIQKTKVLDEDQEFNNEERPLDGTNVHYAEDNERRPKGGWKKKKLKKDKKFKTVRELLKENEHNFRKGTIKDIEIVDMRGSEVKVLKNLKDLTSSKANKSQYIPELQFNVRELVRLTENSIREVDDKLRFEKDRFNDLDKKREKLEEECKKEKKKIEEFKRIIHILSSCHNKVQKSHLSLNGLKTIFHSMKQTHSEVFEEFHLQNYLIALIQPLINELYQQWSPLEQPDYHVEDTLLPWRSILSVSNNNSSTSTSYSKRQQQRVEEDETEHEYEKLLQDIILPIIRRTFMNDWNPKLLCDNGIELMEQFIDRVCTNGMKTFIIEKLILPKIKLYIQEEWNPRKDDDPVHTWIHPWLVFISIKQFETHGIFNLIKNKLETSVLRDWNNVTDIKPYDILEPWKEVWSDFDRFVVKTITPVLVKAIHQFKISHKIDNNEQIEIFKSIMYWSNLIPEFLITILESQFFPKWWKCLYDWLCDPDCSFEEISNWYQFWKLQFTDNMLENNIINNCFQRGEQMINQALSNQQVTPVHKLQLPSEEMEQKEVSTNRTTRTPTPTTTSASTATGTSTYIPIQKSFKELIADYAEEHNLIFQPKLNQMVDGKQLYNFNGMSTFIENDCLHAKFIVNNKAVWKPIALDDFLAMSNKKQKR